MLQNKKIFFQLPFSTIHIITQMVIPSFTDLLRGKEFLELGLKKYLFRNLIPVSLTMLPIINFGILNALFNKFIVFLEPVYFFRQF
jgi:hypothetical protein